MRDILGQHIMVPMVPMVPPIRLFPYRSSLEVETPLEYSSDTPSPWYTFIVSPRLESEWYEGREGWTCFSPQLTCRWDYSLVPWIVQKSDTGAPLCQLHTLVVGRDGKGDAVLLASQLDEKQSYRHSVVHEINLSGMGTQYLQVQFEVWASFGGRFCLVAGRSYVFYFRLGRYLATIRPLAIARLAMRVACRRDCVSLVVYSCWSHFRCAFSGQN